MRMKIMDLHNCLHYWNKMWQQIKEKTFSIAIKQEILQNANIERMKSINTIGETREPEIPLTMVKNSEIYQKDYISICEPNREWT